MKGLLANRPQGAVCTPITRRFSGSVIVPVQRRPQIHVAVAAQEQEAAQPQEQEAAVVEALDAAQVEEMELQALDAAQEQLLKWMLTKTDEEQDADLDEMVDYDEFGDDEYADMAQEVQTMVEEVDYEFKVGDKVLGTVIDIDEDGAYVEIGAKATAFCPITECSFARLKSVSKPCIFPGQQAAHLASTQNGFPGPPERNKHTVRPHVQFAK